MLRLKLSAGPEWLDIAPGLRLQVLPLTTSLMGRAREALPDLDPDAPSEEIAVALAKAVGQAAIVGWEGVVDDATGDPVPVSPAAVAAVLEVFPVFEAWQVRYMQPGLLLQSEKNGSGPSPIGTSAGDKATAVPAAAAAPSAQPS